jgi:hypothetical protein
VEHCFGSCAPFLFSSFQNASQRRRSGSARFSLFRFNFYTLIKGLGHEIECKYFDCWLLNFKQCSLMRYFNSEKHLKNSKSSRGSFLDLELTILVKIFEISLVTQSI